MLKVKPYNSKWKNATRNYQITHRPSGVGSILSLSLSLSLSYVSADKSRQFTPTLDFSSITDISSDAIAGSARRQRRRLDIKARD
jgi:hypothetical protein